jgi:very-short-patch-repair endonuclease
MTQRRPDTVLETHDRLRREGFGVVSVVSARRAIESRAYLTQWLGARGRSVVVAPELSVPSGLRAFCYRLGRNWQNGEIISPARSTPVLLFSGLLRETLKVAADLTAQHPVVPVVVPASTDSVLATLLDQATPTHLVSTALQGLVSVEPEEEKILSTVVNARQLTPLLRSPYEGLVYYMLEARRETRGRFRTNRRINKIVGQGSHEVDLLAEDARLIIEVDGEQHRAPAQIIRDTRKQRELEELGYRVRRFSATQVTENPVGVWQLICEQLQLAAGT